jgi:hypothetical protein
MRCAATRRVSLAAYANVRCSRAPRALSLLSISLQNRRARAWCPATRHEGGPTGRGYREERRCREHVGTGWERHSLHPRSSSARYRSEVRDRSPHKERPQQTGMSSCRPAEVDRKQKVHRKQRVKRCQRVTTFDGRRDNERTQRSLCVRTSNGVTSAS